MFPKRLDKMVGKLTKEELELGRRKMELHENTIGALASMVDAFTQHVDQQAEIGIDPEEEQEIDLDTEDGQELMQKSMHLWMPFLSWVGTQWLPAVLDTLGDIEQLDEDLEETIRIEAMKDGVPTKEPTMN